MIALVCMFGPRHGRSYMIALVCMFGPRQGRSYMIALVCMSMYVCMYVCLYVCNKNQLCQFSQFWLQRFFLTWGNERGHQYLSNGEGPMSIDARGAPFWALFRPKFAQ